MSLQLKYDLKIFIIGMMGAGKTSVGMTLSRLIGFPFVDIDELIGIDSYFNNHSMRQFRLEEINQIDKISNKSGSYVISVGGGSVLASETRKILSQHTCFFLQASIDTLIHRISNQNINRPLIKFMKDTSIDKESFVQLYNKREPHYLDLANFIIDTDNLDILNTSMSINNTIINHEIIS